MARFPLQTFGKSRREMSGPQTWRPSHDFWSRSVKLDTLYLEDFFPGVVCLFCAQQRMKSLDGHGYTYPPLLHLICSNCASEGGRSAKVLRCRSNNRRVTSGPGRLHHRQVSRTPKPSHTISRRGATMILYYLWPAVEGGRNRAQHS